MKNKEQASELLKLIIRSQEKDKASSIDAHSRSPSPKTRDFASLDLKSKNNHHENDDNENDNDENDNENEKMLDILKIVIPKLRRLYEQDKNIKILFHCYAGVSRSSTVAIAYLSKITNKTTREIYELVKEKRPRINPNTTFRKMIGLD